MNIALIVHDLHEQRGHSLYAKVLANQLSKRHHVSVFANSFERSNGHSWSPEHVMAWRASALACVQTFPIGLRVHRQTLETFDIRHAQGYCGGRPNVVTAHICVAAYLNSLRDVRLRNRASLNLMAAAEKRFYRRFDGRIIAVSQKVARELKEFYNVAASITVIPHGVSRERFSDANTAIYRGEVRKELGVSPDETMVLYVGDLTKAHSYLKELSAAAPEIKFVIITPSRAYHWNAVNVQILSQTPRIERYYAAADAFVFPTTYDSFGMVVLEAMAAGLPVLISDRAGAADVIESGHNGFVFPLDNWVGSTTSQLQDREGLTRIRASAARTAEQYEWSTVVTAVEKVYREVLNR